MPTINQPPYYYLVSDTISNPHNGQEYHDGHPGPSMVEAESPEEAALKYHMQVEKGDYYCYYARGDDDDGTVPFVLKGPLVNENEKPIMGDEIKYGKEDDEVKYCIKIEVWLDEEKYESLGIDPYKDELRDFFNKHHSRFYGELVPEPQPEADCAPSVAETSPGA